MGENNSHNRKQLWEDGIKLEPHISERTDEDLEEKLFFGLQMTTKYTTNITEILRENENRKGWANNEKNLNEILEKACD